jgi:hypothetical protein
MVGYYSSRSGREGRNGQIKKKFDKIRKNEKNN